MLPGRKVNTNQVANPLIYIGDLPETHWYNSDTHAVGVASHYVIE